MFQDLRPKLRGGGQQVDEAPSVLRVNLGAKTLMNGYTATHSNTHSQCCRVSLLIAQNISHNEGSSASATSVSVSGAFAE